ncbi:uncharacterized protein LOC133192410 [Saccostrea echinata]|uniref:uncharacterized protein LOC133192410 n=1 Tax=Saccostrea echinata TaxID=191078 RepID=UPI002A82EE3A|nr:uncharacterized protein LOC133192410 [Saccostrea echinata]
MKASFIIEVLLLFIISNTKGKFLGGTISSYFYNNVARLTYRLVWERGTGPCGPPCSLKDIGKQFNSLPPSLSSLKWRCTAGCSTNTELHDVSYTLTAFSSSNLSGWEQGETFFFYPGWKINNTYEVSLSGLDWLAPASGLGKMVAGFDFGIRNDTGVPNASPISAVPSELGIQFGCTTVINIPAEDPDADSVRCRLATPTECGDACTSAPNITLNWETCSIAIPATTRYGYEPNKDYRITVMVEDYPDYTISVGNQVRSIRRPISKIPTQFTITTINRQQSCSNIGMRIDGVIPNPRNLFRVSYAGKPVEFNGAFYMQSPNINDTTFITSFFAGVVYTVLPDDENRTIGDFRDDVRRVRYVWKSYDPRQYADTLLCVWGRGTEGITTDRFCYTAVLIDSDDCGGVTCLNGGKCVDLYKRWTCKCPHGYKPKDCSHKVTCADFPCKNNGTCVDTGTMYTCACISGFTGLDCEIELTVTGTYIKDFKVVPAVLGTIGGVALAFVTTGCCWWCLFAAKRPDSREKKKRVSPGNLHNVTQEQDLVKNGC